MSLYALVPAAGRAERFGSPKLLSRWKDRELLGHVLATLSGARAAGVLAGTFVVHRTGDEAVALLADQYLAYPVPARNPDGELSDTLRSGIAEIRSLDSPHGSSAILICLGDQPLLRLDVIQALAQSWQAGAPAARPSYREAPGVPGHPMLIDRSLWSLAAEMTGETGFGPVLERRGIFIRTVPVGGHNPDIDTPDDLRALDPAEPGL